MHQEAQEVEEIREVGWEGSGHNQGVQKTQGCAHGLGIPSLPAAGCGWGRGLSLALELDSELALPQLTSCADKDHHSGSFQRAES